MTNPYEPRTLPDALAAWRRAIRERNEARDEANKYYNALTAALTRHSADRLSVEVVGFTTAEQNRMRVQSVQSAALKSKPL